jgi:radical SAM protein with 4Fe4S-binding SPASM domain
MTNETFAEVLSKCLDGGKTYFCLTPMHGEPFADPNFIDKLWMLEKDERVDKFFFATNLVLTSDEQMIELLKMKKLFLEVSVYGFSEEEYEEITGRDLFDTFVNRLSSYFRLSMEQKRFMKNVVLYVRSVHDDVLENWMTLGSLGMLLRNIKLFAGGIVSQDEMLNFNLGGQIPDGMIQDMYPSRKKIGICPTARSGCVNENGEYCMCYMNDPEEDMKIGNLLDDDLEKLENSPSRFEMLQNMKSGHYEGPCKKCNEIW